MTWCLASYKLCAATVLLLCANLWVGNSCKNTFCLPRPPLKYRYNTFEEKGLKDRKLAVDALGFGWPRYVLEQNKKWLGTAMNKTKSGSVLPS